MQYIIFKANKEEYGLDLLQIREICHYQKITKLPMSKESILGIIDYRGEVIPIIDIKSKLGFNPDNESITNSITNSINDYITEDTRIITIMKDNKHIGLLVDSVSSIVDIVDFENLDGKIITVNFIEKIGKINNRIISIIDIDKLV